MHVTSRSSIAKESKIEKIKGFVKSLCEGVVQNKYENEEPLDSEVLGGLADTLFKFNLMTDKSYKIVKVHALLDRHSNTIK